MPKALFIETSALLSFLFNEERKKEVQKEFESSERILASRLIKLETERAIHRLRTHYQCRESDISEINRNANLFWSKCDFVELTKEICDLAGDIYPSQNLRSLDAIHLASFHYLQSKISNASLLSFDKRISEVLGS